MFFELINPSLGVWAIKAMTVLITFHNIFVVSCSIPVYYCVCF